MNILVINSGSSSLKFQVINTQTKEPLIKGAAEGIGLSISKFIYKQTEEIENDELLANHKEAIARVFEIINETIGLNIIEGIGHRVVHGGEKYTTSALITKEVMNEIEELSSLAPLHNPANLQGIKATEEIMPQLKQVAVFDTSFHQTIPQENYMYALPYELYEKYKIRRYGFHGTSHKYVMEKTLTYLPEIKNMITCHIGNGSSICAIKNLQSFNTTMGFTPLEGLPMGTRSGNIDPGIIEFLMNKENKSIGEIMTLLNKESGLKGLCGDNDMRIINTKRKEDVPRNKHRLAYNFLANRIKHFIGGYYAELNGAEAIVFTAGLGERAWYLREKVCTELENLGVILDKKKNEQGVEGIISKPESPIKVLMIHTNEEYMIAKEAEVIIKN